jgi:hypothetical protein
MVGGLISAHFSYWQGTLLDIIAIFPYYKHWDWHYH